MKTNLKIIVVFFIFSIFSCSRILLIEFGNKEDAIKNVIYDFHKNERPKKNKVYEIINLEDNDNLYAFMINEIEFYSPLIISIHGKKTIIQLLMKL